MEDIINECAIRRLIEAGYEHPILDLIVEIDQLLAEVRKVEK